MGPYPPPGQPRGHQQSTGDSFEGVPIDDKWEAPMFTEDWPKPQEQASSSDVGHREAEQSSREQSADGKHPSCDFEDDLDYLGKDVGTVEGLTDQACCELCARKRDSCTVAVMSSQYDEPPRACWLKTGVRKAVKKPGVRACW